MTALKEDTSLSSKFGLFYPLLSPQIKNNINSNYIDDYSYVDILKLESGLILLIHQTCGVVIRQGSRLKELTASQRPRGERQDLMLQSPEPFDLTA